MNIGIVCYPTFGGSGVVATELGKKFEIPVAYNKEADTQSWSELDKFLTSIF